MPYFCRESFSDLRNVLFGHVKENIKSLLGEPIFAPIRSWYTGVGSVLVYHRVTEFKDYSIQWRDPNHFTPNLGLSVHVERFQQQLQYVREHATPIALSQIFDLPPREMNHKPYVIVTFDDGYLDNLELALPIAEEFEIPITVFVTTEFVSRKAFPWWIALEELLGSVSEVSFEGELYRCETVEEQMRIFDTLEYTLRRSSLREQAALLKQLSCQICSEDMDRLFMNWEQLATFAEHPLVTIGAHTLNHPVLSQEARKDAQFEIEESRRRLKDNLNQEIDFFAYPFGDAQACARRESEIAGDAGFTATMTTRSGHLFEAHAQAAQMVPRVTIDYFDDLLSFSRKLSGVESLCSEPLSRFVTF